MSDSSREIIILSESLPVDLYLINNSGTREKATAELVVGPVSKKNDLCIKVEGKEPLIAPMEQNTDAVLVKTIGGMKQAWGVAINHKDQLIVVAGREGLKEEMAHIENHGKEDIHKVACESEVKEKDTESGEKSMKGLVKKDSDQVGDCMLILSLEGKRLTSFGPKGERDGEFNMPHGVAVDDDDNI